MNTPEKPRRAYARRLTRDEWAQARRYWQEHGRISADAVALKFGTTREAVRHRITRDRWQRGFEARVVPVDSLCPACFDAEINRSRYVLFLAPFAARTELSGPQAHDEQIKPRSG